MATDTQDLKVSQGIGPAVAQGHNVVGIKRPGYGLATLAKLARALEPLPRHDPKGLRLRQAASVRHE